MATLSTVPEVVDIEHYGGDTLTVRLDLPDGFADAALEWRAQIKSAREQTTPDAVFAITEPTGPGTPAFLVLSSADSARLVGVGTGALGMGQAIIRRRAKDGTLRVIRQYSGQWDVQVSGIGGVDPVRTLVQGALTIEIDVTREETP